MCITYTGKGTIKYSFVHCKQRVGKIELFFTKNIPQIFLTFLPIGSVRFCLCNYETAYSLEPCGADLAMGASATSVLAAAATMAHILSKG